MFAGAERCRGHGGEILRVDNALDIQSGGRDPIIGQQCAGHFGQAGLRLIADTGDIGDWQTARLHAHIDHDVGGLADQRDTTVDQTPAMLVWPQHCPIKIVQHAIAVRSQ